MAEDSGILRKPIIRVKRCRRKGFGSIGRGKGKNG
jgi:hypothetical protein